VATRSRRPPILPTGTGCSWADLTRGAVLAAGLGRGTVAQPLALVLVSPQTGRALFAGVVFRDHRWREDNLNGDKKEG
jgi:hypothetical protein